MMKVPVKLRIEDVEDIERSGGLEAYLVSDRLRLFAVFVSFYTNMADPLFAQLANPNSAFSNHGIMLRQALFQELNRMRETGTWTKGPGHSTTRVQMPSTVDLLPPSPTPKPRPSSLLQITRSDRERKETAAKAINVG